MSQDCLSREPNAIFPTLRSRSIFSRNNSSKQKKIHLSAREMHDECSTSVSVEIICFEHLQQGSYGKVNFEIFLQDCLQSNALKLQSWCLFGRWLLCSVLEFEISHPHITPHVLFAEAFNYLRRKGLRLRREGLRKFRSAKKVGKIYIFVV